MINDIKLGFKVLKYGLQFKSSIFGITAFIILGGVFEFSTPDMPIGGLYIAMGALFLVQLIQSVSVSNMVQTSPYKKKLQTVVPAYVSVLVFLVLNTMQLIVTFLAYAYHGKSEAQLSNFILWSSILMVLIIIYMGAAYKAFWVSTIVFAIGVGGFSAMTSFKLIINGEVAEALLPLGVSVLVSYLLIFAGCGIMYLIFQALYKKDYSKMTFASALSRAK